MKLLLFPLLLLGALPAAGAGPRPIPASREFAPLFLPESFLAYDFFLDSAAHPFQPAAPSFCLANAWWCAEASLLVYVLDPAFVSARLAAAGLPAVTRGASAATALGPDTQVFVAASDDFVLVAFRGSELRLNDWISDLSAMPVPVGQRGRVHAGFLAALDDVWAESLAPELERLAAERPGRPVWFTGHSLGAALAVLAADRFFAAHPAVAGGVYTLGQPPLADAAFAEAYLRPAYRVTNGCDLVARLPRVAAGPVGRAWGLDAAGCLAPGEGESTPTFLRNFAFFADDLGQGRLTLLPQDVVDHSPLLYALRLWNCLAESPPPPPTTTAPPAG